MKLFVWDFHGVLERGNEAAIEVLSAIAAAGNDQIVISSVAKQDLKMFVHAVGYKKFFPEGKYLSAYGFWHGYRSKTAVLLEYLKKSGKNYDKVVIIGDSKKDIMDLPGAVTYLYAHPWKEFKDVQTDYKIHDLREVLKEV